jgi:hypothetical protein
MEKIIPDGSAYELEPWDDVDEILAVVNGLGGEEATYDMIDNTVLALSISVQLQQAELRGNPGATKRTIGRNPVAGHRS